MGRIGIVCIAVAVALAGCRAGGTSSVVGPAPIRIYSASANPSNSRAEYFKYRQVLDNIGKRKFAAADRKAAEEASRSNDIATAGFGLLELAAAYHQGLYPQQDGLDLIEQRIEKVDGTYAAFLLINVEKFLNLPKDAKSAATKADMADIKQTQKVISEGKASVISPGERTVVGTLASHDRHQAKVCIAQILVAKKGLSAADKEWAKSQVNSNGQGKKGDEAKYWDFVSRVVDKKS